MNGKIYLIEYTIIVCIMMFFNRSHSLENMLIAFAVVLIQILFDNIRMKNKITQHESRKKNNKQKK